MAASDTAPAVEAEAVVAAHGVVVSADDGAPLAGVTVTVGGQSARTDSRGRYRIEVPASPLYTVRVSGAGHYPADHAFARHELAVEAGTLRIPPVQLVERRADRQLFVFGGDVMGGRRYETPLEGERRLVHDANRREDMRALLDVMAPTLRAADLASVNLEITLSARELTTAAPKSYVFYAHPELAETLAWAGVDYAAQGNNHVYDYLDQGLADTLAAVAAAGLGYSGAGFDRAAAIAPWRTQVGGTDWSFLSFVGWEGRAQPNQVAEDAKGGAALGDDATIVETVQAESSANRSVVVQYHGSREYSPEPTEESRRRMFAAIDAGADLVIGHHPHVLQGFEFHRGQLIAYSLGNFLFDQYIHETQASMLLKVWMDGSRFARAEIVPIDVRDYRPVPAVAGMRDAVLRRLRALSGPRGVRIEDMAGHGIIAAAAAPNAATPPAMTLMAAPDAASVVVPASALAAGFPAEARDDAGRQLSFGRDLLWRGDFESHEGFAAYDRSWTFDGGEGALDRDAHAGDHALRIVPAANSVTMAQRIALRDLDKAPVTVGGILSGEGTRLTLQYRLRLDGEKAFSEWQNGGTITAAGPGWQRFAFDIPQPSADPTRFNIRFVADWPGNARRPFLLDDLKVISWENGEGASGVIPGLRKYVRLPATGPDPQSITVHFQPWQRADSAD
ncbi:CapA family protein [Pelagerythrobacter marensis]|uniref:CapA family protein n=1 Tax=Pelagerythrobacter marensis TaxID=543877 RepID=UPI00064A9E92|nr:CapA family protein [Pelagerythrobacter marensis]